jgi:drug/metabolite transporter (DMT)-like permease
MYRAMTRSDVLKMMCVALLWALCFPLLKVGLAGGTSPLLFGALRTALASIVLAGVAIRRKERIAEIGKRKPINVFSKLNVFIFLTPAFSLLMGMIFFSEKIRGWEMVGIGAILVGVFLTLERRSSEVVKSSAPLRLLKTRIL